MPLHPQCQALIDAAAAASFESSDHLAIRRGYDAATEFYRHPTPPLDSVANLMFGGPAGNVPVRLYRPRSAASTLLPVVVYYHGGGWVVGGLDSHDHLCRYLAANSGAVVVAVDYRLAPEHKFPAAFDDAVAAARWVAASAAELGIDAHRIALAGDSAGGNLAAATALALRDEGWPRIKLQVLIYPAVDFTADNASLHDNATGYLLTRAAMEQFTDWYLPSRIARSDPHASPQLAADHSGLPAAWICATEYDPLRDEAERYAETLKRAGVAVEYTCYAGMIHGFARMGARIDLALAALDDVAAALGRAFRT